MSSSSPAHSSVSAATSVGGGGQGGSSSNAALVSDDNSSFHFPTDLISPQDRKEEALLVLKSDLMAALHKVVKSLDDDNWMFTAPRSQINLISRPGGFPHKKTEIAKRWNFSQPK
ncbi:PREDICTED: uncharacterized protein LOC104611475 [Nelumbo nucifera]|uniref:Uncharacterized protein LOC104611475 n=1 Tax=Nelumbo nucifera TaxID=4432 RepID=A0A1U8B752_NELNU|nr:PREDICTED: uncharacterized protein LOC104611475 [Nelumbo nucifera]XP_010276850.1 PREDICTED: uncharacterized protein LOC104611475 [Nelumbo nucifera]